MRFEWTFATPAGGAVEVSLSGILAVWSDRSFYGDLARELHLDDHDVSIEEDAQRLVVEQQLTFSTRQVPAMFRNLLGVGESMTVSWRSDLPVGGGAGTSSAATADRKLSFDARTSLTSQAAGITWLVEGPVQLQAPWPVRAVAESKLTQLLRTVLADQAAVTERRLAS